MTDPDDRCALCGGQASRPNPLVPDEFDGTSPLHLECLNSAEGRAWSDARAEADPVYARYCALITLGHPVRCVSCGSLERLSPKASGMGAGHWEVSCNSCHRYRPLLIAYRPEERALHHRLAILEIEFKRGQEVADILRQVQELARQADPDLESERCDCGSRFSVAASPRCSRCAEVLIDSPFHFNLPSEPGTAA